MRARVVAAMAALVVAVGVVAWGIASARNGHHVSAGNVHHLASSPAASPSLSPSPSPAAASLTAGKRLVFHQAFTAPLDPSVWGTCYPWAAGPTGCTNFGNPEYQWYLPSQVQVAGGALHLIATPQPTQGRTRTGQPELYACRSGMVTSYPGFKFEYGYVSVVAQIPNDPGLWPGLWLGAANWKWPPEIDILERWGPPASKAGVYFHPVSGPLGITHLNPAMLASLGSGWHTFSVSWTSQVIVWYVDGTPLMTVTSNIPHQQMYFVADLANYTKTGGCAGQLLIKSIDVWQTP